MSISNFFSLNIGTIPIIYALDNPDPLQNILILCKLQFYFRHTPYQMMRTFMILACINRYIASHVQHRLQFFNQYKLTIRCIIFVVIFWLLVCSFIPVFVSIENGVCGINNDSYALIYSIYLLIFAGILPPLLMTISSLLIIFNLKKIRTRIQPQGQTSNNNQTRKRDRDYIRMLLVEIMIYVLIQFPFTLVVFYTTVTQLDDTTNNNSKQWVIFLVYITRTFLVYLHNSLPFYIYITMSKSFRNEFKELITKWYLFIKNIKQ